MNQNAISLRAPLPQDAQWIATHIAHDKVQVMLTAPPHPYRIEHAHAWIERQKDEKHSFIIELAHHGRAGTVTIGTRQGAPELGYWLQPEVWGQGVMTRAASMALDHYFQINRTTVVSGYILGNTGSAAVLGKLGFRNTHHAQRYCNYRSAEVELQRMELSATTWQCLRQRSHSSIASASASETGPDT